MLIEMRAYTLKPGNVQAFLDAQSMRGFDPSRRPIMARLLGYFTEVYGTRDRVVHFWRFDSYNDWITRLHGPDPSRDAYFQVVRPLMLVQENSFLLPAPVPALTPFWGNGRDWLPGQKPPLGSPKESYVEMTRIQLFPGSLPAYWQACMEHAAGNLDGLLGCFYTLVGSQHQVIWLRHGVHSSSRLAAQEGSGENLALDREIASLVASRTTSLLSPVITAPMSPLFSTGTGIPGTSQ